MDSSHRDTDTSFTDDPRVRVRALAYLFGAGAALTLVSLLLPHSGDDRALAAIGAVGLATSILLLAMAKRAGRLVHAIVAFGSVLISALVYFAGASDTYAAFYVWVSLYAFYFFTRWQAALHLLWVAVLYAAVLLVGTPAPDPFARWLVAVGTNVVAGLLVGALVTQLRARASDAGQRADRVRAEQRRTRAILDAANEAFVAIDDTAAIVDVNPCAEQISGWSREELVGRPFADLIPPDQRAALSDQVARLVRGEDRELLAGDFQFAVLHRDGHIFPAEATISSLEDDDRNGWTLSAFVRDISERKQTERAMRDQIEDLEVIAAVARDLAGVTHAEAARPAICKAGARLTQAALVVLYEPDAKGLELVPTAVFGAREKLPRLAFSGRPSGAGSAFSTAKPVFVADCAKETDLGQRMVEGMDVRSALWQPIVSNGVPIGVLALGWTEKLESVSARMESVVDLLAAEASVAIERADLLGRLESVARTDELTGLANRRAWDEQLPREMARAGRHDSPLCVAMLDLDHFKAFNDRLGHPAGDRLLKELTAQWRSTLRPADLIARYGGEEFVVLLVGCDLELGMEVVERLRRISVEGQTCSAGLARWDGEESAHDLLERADRALYEAKRTGRDRAVSL